MADSLPPLREVIARHGLSARKSLGQNFILDMNLTRKIARHAGSLDTHDILEIGPGPGGLTRGLLAEGARKVVAIEKDRRCLDALRHLEDAYPGRLHAVMADALDFDPAPLLRPPVRIVANLPYGLSTRLLASWLRPGSWPPFWSTLTLMFQKEVADRIVASPGSKGYGRLSILASWRCDARVAMTVPPRAFTPAPKVSSAVVHFERLESPRHEADEAALFRICEAVFQERRKMLRSSLRKIHPEPERILEAAGIDPASRPEQIPLSGFCRLSLFPLSP